MSKFYQRHKELLEQAYLEELKTLYRTMCLEELLEEETTVTALFGKYSPYTELLKKATRILKDEIDKRLT